MKQPFDKKLIFIVIYAICAVISFLRGIASLSVGYVTIAIIHFVIAAALTAITIFYMKRQ